VCRKYSKYKNHQDWCTDPRTTCTIDGCQKDISHYYWNLYYPDDKIVHGDGYCIHHDFEVHWWNTKDNLRKWTFSYHSIWHNEHKSDEWVEKLRKSKMGDKNPMYGDHPSEETIRKHSKSMMGDKNPMFGKHLSKETKQLQSEAQSKPILVGGKQFKSCKVAAEFLGVTMHSIYNIIRAKKPGYSYIKKEKIL